MENTVIGSKKLISKTLLVQDKMLMRPKIRTFYNEGTLDDFQLPRGLSMSNEGEHISTVAVAEETTYDMTRSNEAKLVTPNSQSSFNEGHQSLKEERDEGETDGSSIQNELANMSIRRCRTADNKQNSNILVKERVFKSPTVRTFYNERTLDDFQLPGVSQTDAHNDVAKTPLPEETMLSETLLAKPIIDSITTESHEELEHCSVGTEADIVINGRKLDAQTCSSKNEMFSTLHDEKCSNKQTLNNFQMTNESSESKQSETTVNTFPAAEESYKMTSQSKTMLVAPPNTPNYELSQEASENDLALNEDTSISGDSSQKSKTLFEQKKTIERPKIRSFYNEHTLDNFQLTITVSEENDISSKKTITDETRQETSLQRQTGLTIQNSSPVCDKSEQNLDVLQNPEVNTEIKASGSDKNVSVPSVTLKKMPRMLEYDKTPIQEKPRGSTESERWSKKLTEDGMLRSRKIKIDISEGKSNNYSTDIHNRKSFGNLRPTSTSTYQLHAAGLRNTYLRDVRVPKLLWRERMRKDQATIKQITKRLAFSERNLQSRMIRHYPRRPLMVLGSSVFSLHPPEYIHELVDRLSAPAVRTCRHDFNYYDESNFHTSVSDCRSSTGCLFPPLSDDKIYEITERMAKPTYSTRLRNTSEAGRVRLPKIHTCKRCTSTPSCRFADEFSIDNI